MENIALLKPTSQRYKRGKGQHAVDDDVNTIVIGIEKGEQWWSVDLRKQTMVTHLTIYKKGKISATYSLVISVYPEIALGAYLGNTTTCNCMRFYNAIYTKQLALNICIKYLNPEY